MSDDGIVRADDAPSLPVRRRRGRWQAWLLGLLAILLTAGAIGLWWLDTEGGHRFVAARISAMRPASGLRMRIGRIDGSIYSSVVLRDVAVGDPQAVVARLPVAYLDWYPVAWLSNRLDIDRLHVPRLRLDRLPKLRPTGKARPILPNFDIRLADLRIDRIDLGPGIAGRPRRAFLKGRADVRGGRAIVALDARSLDAGDAMRLSLDSRPDDRRFDLEALVVAPRDGVLAVASGLKRPFAARITGDGDARLWRGQALVALDGARASRIGIVRRDGRYRLNGTIEAAMLGNGLGARLAAPRLTVVADGGVEGRLVQGTAAFSSGALRLEAKGGIDLGRSSFDNLILDVKRARANALIRNASSDGLVARARLMGPFATARYEYLLTARRLGLGKVRVEGLRSAGKGRLALSGTTVLPLELSAGRVTVDDRVVDDVLRDVSIDGLALLKAGVLTARNVAIRSNKVRGRMDLLLDLARGSYTAGFTGGVTGIEVPRFGRIDLDSKVDAVSHAGIGLRLTGRARARMRRLDNAFLRGLGGGLPEVTSDLAYDGDGRVRFDRLVLTAPALRLTATGYRAPDKSFHFTGEGTHKSYGPLKLVLDGKIDRPKVDLILARPLPALGLKDVHAILLPDAAGYAVTAEGTSTLGPFAANGAVLLPRGMPALIQVERLEFSRVVASGILRPSGSGLVGTLDMTGPASGPVTFAMIDGVQQIGVDLTLDRARFEGPPQIAVGRGAVKATILLVPGATSIDGTLQGNGLRYGRTRIGRFQASAKLVEGSGTITASAAGQGGRLFDVQARATISPGAIRIAAGGSLDRSPLRLSRTATVIREGQGWRLAPVTLTYRAGSLRIGGLFGPDMSVDATISRLPLAVLDLVDSDLGLGGLVSGTVAYRARQDAAPVGSARLRARGLTRSGLALSSAPVDIGVNAQLDGNRAAMRAVVASGGRVTGRAQALISPLGRGGLMQRLAGGTMRAQLRYGGDAGVLWGMSNVELFSLSGPVAINADVTGTLDDPVIRGTVNTSNAALQSPVTGMALAGLSTRGTFDGASLALDRITARTQGGGSVRGAGRFLFSARGVGIDLAATLDRAVVLDRDDIGATVSGPIRIRSDGDGGVISGDFNVVRSRFTLGSAAAVAAIPQLRVIETNRRGQVVEPDRPRSPWRLAIKARVPGGLAVTGLGMDSEWSADLAISGTVSQPVLTGPANLLHGDYDFAGRRFELLEGRLRFTGETPIDPSLNIRAQADVNNINATITVTGSSAKPIVSFASVPALPQEELLSRILFGTSVANLSAPEALQLASAIAAFQGQGGDLDPINALRRAAGLSRLRILPADVTTGQRTSLAAGKNVTRKIYVELISDGQGYNATRIEYQITRWLALIGAASTIGRESVNLRATKDY